jgi:type I restriction enzyme S subunit
LNRIPLLLPESTEERKRIVSILSSLDDKIDLLHRENATLEQMAETLFRQWFVVEAKEEWKEGKLGDICNYVNEKIDIDNVETSDYISTENMCPNKQGVVLASSVPENGKATKYRIDDVLLSNIRPYFKKIWLADKDGGCSADVLCIRSRNEIHKFFTYYTIRQDEFFDYVMLGSKGCKMPRGDKSHIMNWPIIIPTKDILLNFNRIVSDGIDKIRSNKQQIQTLIQTRDGFLPRLMNGEVKI